MTTSHLRDSRGQPPSRLGFLLIPLILACIGLLPKAQATDLGGALPGGNTADGSGVLVNLTSGTGNSGFGYLTLDHDTTGINNTATGFKALSNNTTGLFNTANGYGALFRNTTINGQSGNSNTATGYQALFNNTTGISNTVDGNGALYTNSTGGDNTATGDGALYHNTIGFENTAIGLDTLNHNTTGHNNIAAGGFAGAVITQGSNNIDIGNDGGTALESNTIRIGFAQTATYIAGIFGTMSTGSPVGVDSSGHLGVLATSSARFKDDIKPIDKASEAILALRPVTFHYKKEIDPKRTAQFGLVAEEVEKVDSDLVTRDAKGEVYTVRYDAVNAMLLNEFLKEHREVQELKSIVAKQEATTTQQQKQIESLTARLQKVSDQLELSKPAPQMVLNHQ